MLALGESQLLSQISEFALAQMGEGLVAFSQDKKIVFWSDGMTKLLGIDAESASHRTVTELLPFIAGDARAIADAWSGKVSQGVSHRYFVESNKNHGRFQLTYGPLFVDKAVIAVVCFVRQCDATSDMQHLTGLLHQRLRLLADAMPGLVWLCDQNGERFLFNQNYLQFTGRTLGQERGRGWLENVERQDVHRLWQHCSAALRERRSYHVEYRLRRADGQYRLILESATPHHSSDGTFLGMMGSCSDVSATQFSQQSRPPSTAAGGQLSATDHAPLAILRLDRELTIRKVNLAGANLVSMTEQQLVGKGFDSVISSVPEETFRSVLERGEHVRLLNHQVSVRHPGKNSDATWDIFAWPLKNNDGQVTGVGVNFVDVSERERLSLHRDEIVAALVHDLKTPLVGADRTLEQMIKGALGDLGEEQTEVLNMLRRSNHQLLLMVQNLIEVYRYQAGQSALLLEEFDMTELIRGATQELKALAEHRGIALSLELPESLLFTGDRLALRRVVLNLLDNAFKFTTRGGSVKAHCSDSNESVVVKVSDTGIGIAPEDQPRLFQQYWQGESGKKYAPGTGLGLYLCKQIVSAHNGQISVVSKPGEGTTFSIVLPRMNVES
jgi:PAS domain S-box-containing protein